MRAEPSGEERVARSNDEEAGRIWRWYHDAGHYLYIFFTASITFIIVHDPNDSLITRRLYNAYLTTRWTVQMCKSSGMSEGWVPGRKAIASVHARSNGLDTLTLIFVPSLT